MKRHLFITFTTLVCIFSLGTAFAETAPADSQDHEKHHPKEQESTQMQGSRMMMGKMDMENMMKKCMKMHDNKEMCSKMMDSCKNMKNQDCKKMLDSMHSK